MTIKAIIENKWQYLVVCFILMFVFSREGMTAGSNSGLDDVVVEKVGDAITQAAGEGIDQAIDGYKKDQQKKAIRTGIVLSAMKKGRERRAARKAELREGLIEETVTIGGQRRNYFVYVPKSYEETKTYALVFVLHGGGLKMVKDIGLHMVKLTKGRFNELAETEDFIVVYPNGFNAHWNDERPNTKKETNNADDKSFFKTMVNTLKQEYPIDPKRIYSTGISNGGLMSYYLACNFSDTFAAVASVAANLSVEEYDFCKPNESVSVMMLNGVDDPIAPWKGGKMGLKRGYMKSNNETRDFWKKVDGCSDEFQSFSQDNDPKDKTSIEGEIYNHCSDGLGVTVYNIHGGGHTWPGGFEDLPKAFVGLTTKEIDGAKVIWDFFKAHPKK
jgi:polyhydroxybutyrate depolymerase